MPHNIDSTCKSKNENIFILFNSNKTFNHNLILKKGGKNTIIFFINKPLLITFMCNNSKNFLVINHLANIMLTSHYTKVYMMFEIYISNYTQFAFNPDFLLKNTP